MPRTSRYAKQLAVASFANARIERLFLLESLSQVVRFTDRRGVHYAGAGLVIAENELLVLLGDAIAAGVFSPVFLSEHMEILDSQRSAAIVPERQEVAMVGAHVSKPGKSVYVQMGVWYNQDTKEIHLTAQGVEGFHTTVNDKPQSIRGHKNLFGKLAKLLAKEGAPHPDIAADE